MRRPRTHTLPWLDESSAESALTVVEVVIAAVLLTAVVSSLALAMVGGARVQSTNRIATGMTQASQRAFEAVRSDTAWMQECTMAEPQEDVPDDGPAILQGAPGTYGSCEDLAATIPDEARAAPGLGDACSGGGPLMLDVEASALPVDSAVDGVLVDDRDGVRPDYYAVTISVSVPPCAAARLGSPDPVTFESALDPRGEVPKGSVVVNVCNVLNQVDDRLSVNGCDEEGISYLELLPCNDLPPVPPRNATRGCIEAWDWAAAFAPDPDEPSTFVALERGSASFTLRNAFLSISSSSAEHTGPGEYTFKGIPAGAYRVDGITPTGDSAGLEYWEQKTLNVAVQPNYRSRALLAFRPGHEGSLTLNFSREVGIRDVQSASVPLAIAQAGVATKTFEGTGIDTYLKGKYATSKCAEYATLAAASPPHVGIDLASYYALLYSWCDFDVTVSSAGNCNNFTFVTTIKGGPVDMSFQIGDSEATMDFSVSMDSSTTEQQQICTVYDFSAGFDYYTRAGETTDTLAGAVLPVGYSSTPAPSFRANVPRATAPKVICNGTQYVQMLVGSLAPPVIGGCVNGLPSPTTTVRFSGLVAGLNSGIYRSSFQVTPGWGNPFLDDGGGEWTVDRNESVKPIPDGLKRGIWVGRDGSITDADGTNHGVNPTFEVIGSGECYWTFNGGSRQQGSCRPCEMYVAPLGGNYGTCFVLHRTHFKRVVRFTGSLAGDPAFKPSPPNQGVIDTVKVCNGIPQRGTVAATAPNCYTPPPVSVGGGGSGGSGKIPAAQVPTGFGGNADLEPIAIGTA